jgi:hypothetical protein
VTTPELVITCTGREYDTSGYPTSDSCGRAFPRRQRWVPQPYGLPWPPPMEPIPDELYITEARAVGWAVHGPHVMCPTCRKPSKELAALCRDLNRSTRGTS